MSEAELGMAVSYLNYALNCNQTGKQTQKKHICLRKCVGEITLY